MGRIQENLINQRIRFVELDDFSLPAALVTFLVLWNENRDKSLDDCPPSLLFAETAFHQNLSQTSFICRLPEINSFLYRKVGNIQKLTGQQCEA